MRCERGARRSPTSAHDTRSRIFVQRSPGDPHRLPLQAVDHRVVRLAAHPCTDDQSRPVLRRHLLCLGDREQSRVQPLDAARTECCFQPFSFSAAETTRTAADRGSPLRSPVSATSSGTWHSSIAARRRNSGSANLPSSRASTRSTASVQSGLPVGHHRPPAAECELAQPQRLVGTGAAEPCPFEGFAVEGHLASVGQPVGRLLLCRARDRLVKRPSHGNRAF